MHNAIYIRGAGISFQDAGQALKFGYEGCDMQATLLPAALRRRTSVATKVAFAAAERACRDADCDPSQLASIFTSAVGEVNVTDRLCSDIAQQRFPLSPTQFHNSVHNTASGYWSIAVGSRKPAMAMAGYHDGFALALLEAWSQLQCSGEDILLVCYEEQPVELMLPDNQWIGCAIAFVLTPRPDGERTAAAIGKPFALRGEEDAQPFGLCSPALAALDLFRTVNSGDVGRVQVSPDDASNWYVELERA